MSMPAPAINAEFEDEDSPRRALPIGTRRAWEARGSGIFMPASNLSRLEQLPPAIYRFVSPPNHPWFFAAVADRFAFPFRLYETHDEIVGRIIARFSATSGNTGALLNGEKGAGKTVAAQLIANRLIDRGLPVLIIDEPVPLAAILEAIEQDVVVIFDEFEKTYRKAEEQAAILTTIDGMGRSTFKRLFLFTTNATSIDTNFIDRPSRIAYVFQFGRLAPEVVETIVTSELDTSRSSLRAQLIDFLLDRKTLTIDVARAMTREVNLFGDRAFDGAFNASDAERSCYDVHLLDGEGRPVRLLVPFFEPKSNDAKFLRRYMQPSIVAQMKATSDLPDFYVRGEENEEAWQFKIFGYADLPDPAQVAFRVRITAPVRATWQKDFKAVFDLDARVDMDIRPADWTVPAWAVALQAGKKLTAAQQREKHAFDFAFCYGGETTATFTVQFTPVRRRATKSYETALAF